MRMTLAVRLAVLAVLVFVPAPGRSAELPVVAPASAGMSADVLVADRRRGRRVDRAQGRARAPSCSWAAAARSSSARPTATARSCRRAEPMTRRHGLRHGLAHQGDRHRDLGDDARRGGQAAARATRSRGTSPSSPPAAAAAPAVTVEQLLTHRAGFVPDDPMDLYTGTPAEIFARKYRQPLAHEPGSRFVYSDVGFEVLGELVRVVSGETLDRYAARVVFAPLGMADTRVPAAAGRRRPRPDPARAHRADRAARRRR